jgi:hypothetical protein
MALASSRQTYVWVQSVGLCVGCSVAAGNGCRSNCFGKIREELVLLAATDAL